MMAVPQCHVTRLEVPNDYPSAHITAPLGWFALEFAELWAYGELLHVFVRADIRDIKVRYRLNVIAAGKSTLLKKPKGER